MLRRILLLHKKSGATLFEFLVFLSLISLIFYLSSQFITVYNRLSVKAELEHLYSLCLYLKRKAYLEGEIKTLKFDLANQTMVYENKVYKLPSGVMLEGPVTFKDHMIFFYKDGIISAGIIYLKDKGDTCLYALTSAVSQVSYIRKYKYTNKKWKLLK